MTNQIIVDRIIDDLIDYENLFKEISNQINIIVKEHDGNDFNLTYDEFCVKSLNNMKKKNINWNSTTKKVKQYFLESVVEIAIDELIKRGKIKESEKVKKYLYEV
jgi:hypothetical protein